MKYTNKSNGHVGDVQYFSIDKLPNGAKKVENQPVAFGEKSGHIHINTGDCELYELNNEFYLVVGPDGALSQHIHQSNMRADTYTKNVPAEKADHNPGILSPNTIYKIGIHKRKKHFSKVWEKVID
jgi:hypothetical protein